MLDHVLGELLLDQLPGDWRQALRAIAQRTRATARRRPWIIGALGQRPTIGPNGMRHREQSAAAVAGLDADLFRKGALLEAVDAYTIGHVTMELAERETQRRERLSDPQWRTATRAYLQRLLDSGDFPQLAGLGPDAGLPPATSSACSTPAWTGCWPASPPPWPTAAAETSTKAQDSIPARPHAISHGWPA